MRSIASNSKVTCWSRISATLLRIMVLELPESAAHVATDPQRVYYIGAGFQPLPAPGAPLFLTRPCLRPASALRSLHNMLDGLRQGLVRHLLKPCSREMKQVFASDALEAVL